LWLSPQQAVVLNITDRPRPTPSGWGGAAGGRFRVPADLRNEKITYKIREHSLQKLPYQLIVGDKEQQA
jgi:threonyl-tRNA synthetase